MNEKQYASIKKEMNERLDIFNASLKKDLHECGRNYSDITLIGVSKFFPPEYAKAAYELGIENLGENRVQELLEKINVLSAQNIHPRWHLIGTLQTNKVKQIIGKTDMIHSVDTLRLIDEIEKKSFAKHICTSILLQVNLSGEESKHGFNADQTAKAIEILNDCKNIRLCGLMTMAPLDASIALPGKVFEDTKKLFEKMRAYVKCTEDWRYLSMGMSQDYIEAIRFGATHIRIGTSIFGSRSL